MTTSIAEPKQYQSYTWRIELSHHDGRYVRLTVEERSPGHDQYCFTSRTRGGISNGVVRSPWRSWQETRDALMGSVKGYLQAGLEPHQTVFNLYHPDGRSFTCTIIENPATVDIRNDSYKLSTGGRDKAKKPFTLAMWPVHPQWGTLGNVRAMIGKHIAERKAEGYILALPTDPAPEDNDPIPVLEPDAELLEWKVYHYKGGTSDKVYSVEFWKVPVPGVPHRYKVTARNGRRNGTLVNRQKMGLGTYAQARAEYEAVCKEKENEGYKKVTPESVNVPSPDGKKIPAFTVPTMPPTGLGLGQNKPEDMTPQGVTFWCNRCTKAILPTQRTKFDVSQTLRFEFACHGKLAARTMTTAAVQQIEGYKGKFGTQYIRIFDDSGSTATNVNDLGSDPTPKSGFGNDPAAPSLPHLPLGAPTTVPAPKPKPPKYTVNTPPPVLPATLVPEAAGVYVPGRRKVRPRPTISDTPQEGEDDGD